MAPDYDQLISQIYQGPLEEKPWQSFLPLLRQAMDAQVVSLILRPPTAGDKGVILSCRRGENGEVNEELADQDDWEATHYREQFFALDPFVDLPAEQVVTQQELVPDEDLLQSAYYRDYLQPIGIFHILGVDTVEPDGMLARLRIARGREEQPFGRKHKALCEQLIPHLRRAIQIHARLGRTESERDLYAGLIKAAFTGLVIAGVGCAQGLQASGGALGVGKAVRRAVITSIVLILVISYNFTWLVYTAFATE